MPAAPRRSRHIQSVRSLKLGRPRLVSNRYPDSDSCLVSNTFRRLRIKPVAFCKIKMMKCQTIVRNSNYGYIVRLAGS